MSSKRPIYVLTTSKQDKFTFGSFWDAVTIAENKLRSEAIVIDSMWLSADGTMINMDSHDSFYARWTNERSVVTRPWY